jgi:PII-like signaling protein
MLVPGPAKKVTIHLNDDTTAHDDFLYREIFVFLLKRGVAGATLTRAQAGFGAHHRAHAAGAAGATGEHLPVRIEFVDTMERVDALLPALCDLVTDGLVEVHDTVIVKAAVGDRSPQ